MFFCEGCRVKNNWPTSVMMSSGSCEVCEKTAECYDVPSNNLPLPKEEKERTTQSLTNQEAIELTDNEIGFWNLMPISLLKKIQELAARNALHSLYGSSGGDDFQQVKSTSVEEFKQLIKDLMIHREESAAWTAVNNMINVVHHKNTLVIQEIRDELANLSKKTG